MAPEIVLNSAVAVEETDLNGLKAVDIWAFGMILFHLLNPNTSYP